MGNESYYKHHVFFCENLRDENRACCGTSGGIKTKEYAKKRLKDLGKIHNINVRVNSAGCLGRCESGPVLVIYPEGVWYTYVDVADIDDIIDEHLISNCPVERLKI